MNKTKLFVLITLSILLLPCTASASGSELHASSCIACHSRMTGGDGSVLYKRTDRLITTRQALAARVQYCAEGANTNWDKDQVKQVTEYLNSEYYQF